MSVWSVALSIVVLQNPAPTPEELIKKIDAHADLKNREKPFEIAASLVRLYASQGRHAEAQAYAKDALTTAAPAITFFIEQKQKLGATPPASAVDAKCEPTEPTLMNVLELARRHAAEKRTPAAVTCARRALQAVPEVMLLEGNARFVTHDLAGARASYDRVVSVFGDVPEALYARGALTFDEKPDDVPALTSAKADLEAFLAAAPTGRQAKNAKALVTRITAAIAAGGTSKLTPVPARTSPPVLDQATIDAFQNAPKTPESEARFAKLIEDSEEALAKGQYQQALDGFKQVMPFQPENPRLRAGMAWSLVQLGKPMAENVWRVATQTPEAVDALGDRLKAKGDEAGARALWTRLAASVPDYAAKVEAKK